MRSDTVTYVLLPGAGGQAAAQRALDVREGRDPDAPFDVMTAFFHDVPEDVVAAAFARPEPRQSGTPFGQPWPLDAWPDVPTSVVAGRYDRLLPVDFVRELAATRLGVTADVIDTGHLPALSRPGELAAWLERDRVTARPSAGRRRSRDRTGGPRRAAR